MEAGRTDAPRAQTDLANLLQRYSHPLYSFVRRQGMSHHDAQDTVQGFFLFLLERKAVLEADARRGRFRTFLLSSLKNYMANAYRRGAAAKRGGGVPLVAWDENECVREDAATTLTPEAEFERLWALAVVDAAMRRTRSVYDDRNRGPIFDALESCVTGEPDAPRYRSLADQLAMTVDAIKADVMRMRREFRAALRREVACGLTDAREIDDEIRYLRRTLAAHH